jgi:AmmeMemoRadiSam system protein B
MIQVREPAVAGFFYPAEAERLKVALEGMLRSAPAGSGRAPKVLIVPHAGYTYSGPVAAAAYAQLLPHRQRYRRVVLLGPAHRVAVRGLASSSASAFRTPLGEVRIDHEALTACGLTDVHEYDAGHRLEHSLEVQLPFLQFVLGEFLLVPLVVGSTAPEKVAEVIDLLWDGPETLIVVSSDLSHYLSYEQAQLRDQATCRAIEYMDASRIGHDDACGAVPLAGLLTAARRRGLETQTLDLRNSGDIAGDKQRVVGYGAWLLREPAS